MYLKYGSRGEDVKNVQEILSNLAYNPGYIDGIFGEKTELAVTQFQEDHNLYADGVVGSNTWNALVSALKTHIDEQNYPINQPSIMNWVRVPADKYNNGFRHFFLREDAAKAYLKVREVVVEAGGILTSSGAKRSLTGSINASRSATSFHYTGRALDLNVGSGMENPKKDPFVAVSDGNRYWRVYARADGGEEMELDAITYNSRKKGRKITGKFLDLTALFEAEGFFRIKARRTFFLAGSYIGAEWWHFQYETGLIEGESTFGEELLKIYTEDQLVGTPPWNFKNSVYGVNWF